MSAFVCTDKHINAIVRWASHNRVEVYGREQQTLEMLLSENIGSVNYRYGDNIEIPTVVYDNTAPLLEPIEVIKACQCLAYQSCEHPGWEASTACALLKTIERSAIAEIAGYEFAKWGIE